MRVLVGIDNGGFPAFLDALLREVGKQIAEALIDVGSSLAGAISAAVGAVIGFIVNLVFGWIKDIWEDDYFPPCPVSFTFNSADDRWAGRTETDPLPIHWWGHGGEYLVWFQARLELAPVARPVGRYNIDTGASGEWHGVLTLGAEGQPAFVNYGYAHEDLSREQLGNVQWNAATRTLSFTRTLYSNVVNQAYVLSFQADGTFSGTCGGGPAKGGPRGQSDAVPLPVGVYDIIANKVFRGVLKISGSDPAALAGTLNLGGGDEALRDVRWDAPNHTLMFIRPGSNQAYGLTFIDQGKVFHGGFGDPSNTCYSANVTRRSSRVGRSPGRLRVRRSSPPTLAPAFAHKPLRSRTVSRDFPACRGATSSSCSPGRTSRNESSTRTFCGSPAPPQHHRDEAAIEAPHPSQHPGGRRPRDRRRAQARLATSTAPTSTTSSTC